MGPDLDSPIPRATSHCANHLAAASVGVCVSQPAIFGYDPAIQLYNRIKTLFFFTAFCVYVSTVGPQKRFIADALPHPRRLCLSASIFAESLPSLCSVDGRSKLRTTCISCRIAWH